MKINFSCTSDRNLALCSVCESLKAELGGIGTFFRQEFTHIASAAGMLKDILLRHIGRKIQNSHGDSSPESTFCQC